MGHVGRWRRRKAGSCRLFGTLLVGLCLASSAAAEIEIVTARFCDLPEGVPVFVFESGMTENDEAVAKRIAEMLALKGLMVLDREPEDGEAALTLTFELDRFVPERPDDKSDFGFEVKGASGSGVHARIIVPKLKKDYLLQPEPPRPVPGPVLSLDMRVDLGASRRVWLGRATAPLGHRFPPDLEREMADRLVNALTNPPDDKCVAPPE